MSVQATGLGHEFVSGRPLFQGLDFTLLPDHVYALTGPSGSGKSTLLSIIAGWLKPVAGQVVRPGVRTIRWVFQNPHGVARRSCLDHVTIGFIAQGYARRPAEGAARQLLARFGLAGVADAPFASLSGGEAQRLMLARGMASGPDLFLVDEPTAQLDRRTADDVSRTMTALAGQGVIVVIATHDSHTRDRCTDVIDLGESMMSHRLFRAETPAPALVLHPDHASIVTPGSSLLPMSSADGVSTERARLEPLVSTSNLLPGGTP